VNQKLLPIFRSDEQASVLTVLFVTATEPLTLTELAEWAGVSLAHAHKEVGRLEAAGLVRSKRRGRNRLVEANPDSPVYDDLRSLLTKSSGPAVVLRRLLVDVAGIEQAFIFGSWAAAFHGDATTSPPGDIDVLVIGTPDIDRLYAAAQAAEQVLRIPVNPTVFTVEEWASNRTGFAETVRTGHQVEVVG
jgi:hypothetical protein